MTYTIESGDENNDLVLDPTTGVLETSKLLDYEKTPVYKVKELLLFRNNIGYTLFLYANNTEYYYYCARQGRLNE